MVVPLLQGLLCSPPVLVRMIFLKESACWYGLVNLLLVPEIRTLEGMVLLQTLPRVLCVICSVNIVHVSEHILHQLIRIEPRWAD